ncbi:arsenic metallochaperone ArsD family protein [Peribacillus butanolivorans]|nr:arsenic metallochaperone ArsD family protein [Peribacillus butanolivorans]
MKVENFDSSMCCSIGVCWPSIDPELTRVAISAFNRENTYTETLDST